MGKYKKRIAVVAGISAVAIAGGTAWAAWTTDATGSATASAGNASALVVTATTTPTGPLVPSGSADLKFLVTNSNPYDVTITSIALAGVTVSGDETYGTIEACQAATGVTLANNGVSTSTAITPPTTITVPKNTTTPQLVTITKGVAMTNDSVNACQGKTFTLGLTVTSASA